MLRCHGAAVRRSGAHASCRLPAAAGRRSLVGSSALGTATRLHPRPSPLLLQLPRRAAAYSTKPQWQHQVTADKAAALEQSYGRLGRLANRLGSSGSSLSFLGRWALFVRNSRRLRLGIRAFRTAVLCFLM